MKWRSAAYLACATAAFAQGDDNLGLPQLDAPLVDPLTASGYFTQDGVVYALIDDRAVPLEREVSLHITPRKIIGFDGRSVRLPAGTMYMANGTLLPLTVAQAAAQAAAPVSTPSSGSAAGPTIAGTFVAVNAGDQPVKQPVVPNVSTTRSGVSQPANTPLYPIEPNPPVSPATQVTAQPHTSPATIPPPQPAFAAPYRPDRTGPRVDVERPIDRTRPESVPTSREYTRMRDDQRPMDRTRPGTDDLRYRDRTMPGPDDYKPRDRTIQGPDDERPPDPTRRSR